jgi:DNA adenine methylase
MAGDVNGWWTAIAMLPGIMNRLLRVEILGQSAFEAIPRFDREDALIYCDPPYVHSTRQENSRNVYHAEMSEEDHVRLAELLKGCESRVVISGYPSALYADLYAGWRVVGFDIANHAAGGRQKGRETECLWLNY